MADIKQAAKWMQNGQRVRRKGDPSPSQAAGDAIQRLRLWNSRERGKQWHPDPFVPRLSDLLADDWEIA